MIGIIGSGPAGCQAAIYLKRANIDCIIFTTHKSALHKANKIDNFYGTSTTGEDLYNRGIEQVKKLNIEIIEEEVIGIDDFNIKTTNDTYKVDKIVLATGRSINKPNIDNIDKYEGKGISYCATCDGFFFKNKKIGIYGTSKYAKEEYEYLKGLSKDVTVFNKIDSVYGEDKLEGIVIDNEKISLDALFIADQFDSNKIAKKLGLFMEDNKIVVDQNMMTNMDGVYAIGDCAIGVNQVAKAVNDGMIAAMDIIKKVDNIYFF